MELQPGRHEGPWTRMEAMVGQHCGCTEKRLTTPLFLFVYLITSGGLVWLNSELCVQKLHLDNLALPHPDPAGPGREQKALWNPRTSGHQPMCLKHSWLSLMVTCTPGARCPGSSFPAPPFADDLRAGRRGSLSYQ